MVHYKIIFFCGILLVCCVCTFAVKAWSLFRGVEKCLGFCRVEVLWIALGKMLFHLVLHSYDSIMSSWSECMQITG